MSVEPDVEAWRRKWEAKGLPPALLDEMIEEARREWEITMGYVDVKLFYDLVINVIDPFPGPEYAYLYVLKLGPDVMRGRLDAATTQPFKEVPAGPVDVEVYKIDAEGRPVAFGRKLIVLARDAYVDVELEAIVAPVGLGAMPVAPASDLFLLPGPRPPPPPEPLHRLALALRAYAAGLRMFLPPLMHLIRPAPPRPLPSWTALMRAPLASPRPMRSPTLVLSAAIAPPPPRPRGAVELRTGAALASSSARASSPPTLSLALGPPPPRPAAQTLFYSSPSVGVRKSP